jgi:hypothetical protein
MFLNNLFFTLLFQNYLLFSYWIYNHKLIN